MKHRIERLRQKTKEMNKIVKQVMKKQAKSMIETKGGANYKGQNGTYEKLMVKLRPLRFRARPANE